MRLFSIPNSQGSEELRKQSEADALWRAIRGEETDPVSNADVASLTWLSDAVRETVVQKDTENISGARDSFAFTHERLMQAISASRPLPESNVEAVPSVAPVRPVTDGHYAAESTNSRPALWDRVFPVRHQWHRPLRYAGVCAGLFLAVFVGRRIAHIESPFFPMAEIVAEYDKDVKAQEVDFDHHGHDTTSMEEVLSPKVGMRVRLPEPDEVGAKLLGVRKFEFDGIPAVEAHFDHGNTRVAFLQAKAPHRSLRYVTEARVNDRLYLVRDLGQYRVAAWRTDESVLAVVSPLSADHALEVAERMRNSVSSESAA